jgi:hypothetical protein
MLRKIHCIMMAAGFTLLARTATTWACAVCLGGESDSLTDGFKASVLFLMATPYLVVGSIVCGLIFNYRRALKSARSRKHSSLSRTWHGIRRMALDE